MYAVWKNGLGVELGRVEIGDDEKANEVLACTLRDEWQDLEEGDTITLEVR